MAARNLYGLSVITIAKSTIKKSEIRGRCGKISPQLPDEISGRFMGG